LETNMRMNQGSSIKNAPLYWLKQCWGCLIRFGGFGG
jgi:hypothetical protein